MKSRKTPETETKSNRTGYEVVASIGKHYQQTRTFKARDLMTVLGDPLGSVSVKAADKANYSFNLKSR